MEIVVVSGGCGGDDGGCGGGVSGGGGGDDRGCGGGVSGSRGGDDGGCGGGVSGGGGVAVVAVSCSIDVTLTALSVNALRSFG